MKRSGRFNTGFIAHLIFWVFIFMIMSMNHMSGEGLTAGLVSRALVTIAILAGAVYLHLHVFERYLLRKRYWPYAFFTAATVTMFVLLRNILFTALFGSGIRIAGPVTFVLSYLVFTASLRLGITALEQRAAIEQSRAMQAGAELESLRAQINPHFLFNTLNNIFGLIDLDDRRARKAVSMLSGLMRYSLERSAAGSVELTTEIEQVRRLIELHKLRYSEDDAKKIGFEARGDFDGLTIAPMLLIPFVENAFKHGTLLDERSFLDVDISAEGDILELRVINSMEDSGGEASGAGAGTGIRNVRRRLELLYPGKHEFFAGRVERGFEVRLRVDLSQKG